MKYITHRLARLEASQQDRLDADMRSLSTDELKAILATCSPAERAALDRMTDEELELATRMPDAHAAAYIRRYMH